MRPATWETLFQGNARRNSEGKQFGTGSLAQLSLITPLERSLSRPSPLVRCWYGFSFGWPTSQHARLARDGISPSKRMERGWARSARGLWRDRRLPSACSATTQAAANNSRSQPAPVCRIDCERLSRQECDKASDFFPHPASALLPRLNSYLVPLAKSLKSGAPDKIRTCDLCLRRENCGLKSCVNVRLPMGSTDFNPRKNKDKSERLVTCLGCRECSKRAPATIISGSLASVARGVAGSPANQHFPAASPIRPHQSKACAGSADHRPSFAPETIATRRNKHDRTRQISMKINASNSHPAAHNGLVGGWNPPGPATQSDANRRFLVTLTLLE